MFPLSFPCFLFLNRVNVSTHILYLLESTSRITRDPSRASLRRTPKDAKRLEGSFAVWSRALEGPAAIPGSGLRDSKSETARKAIAREEQYVPHSTSYGSLRFMVFNWNILEYTRNEFDACPCLKEASLCLVGS